MGKRRLIVIAALATLLSPIPTYADYAGTCPEYFQKSQMLFEAGNPSEVNVYVSWNGGAMEKCKRLEGFSNMFHGSDVHFKWNCGGKTFVQERGNYHLAAVIDKNDRLYDIVRESMYNDRKSLSAAQRKNLFREMKVTCSKGTNNTYVEVSSLTEGKNVEPILVPVVQVIEQRKQYKTFSPSF